MKPLIRINDTLYAPAAIKQVEHSVDSYGKDCVYITFLSESFTALYDEIAKEFWDKISEYVEE